MCSLDGAEVTTAEGIKSGIIDFGLILTVSHSFLGFAPCVVFFLVHMVITC